MNAQHHHLSHTANSNCLYIYSAEFLAIFLRHHVFLTTKQFNHIFIFVIYRYFDNAVDVNTSM